MTQSKRNLFIKCLLVFLLTSAVTCVKSESNHVTEISNASHVTSEYYVDSHVTKQNFNEDHVTAKLFDSPHVTTHLEECINDSDCEDDKFLKCRESLCPDQNGLRQCWACRCREGFYWSARHDTCLGIENYCTSSSNCTALNTECDLMTLKCVCLQGYRNISGICQHRPLYCEMNKECKGSFSVCRENECVCMDDFRATGHSEDGYLYCERKPMSDGKKAAIIIPVMAAVIGVVWAVRRCVQRRKRNLRNSLAAYRNQLENSATYRGQPGSNASGDPYTISGLYNSRDDVYERPRPVVDLSLIGSETVTTPPPLYSNFAPFSNLGVRTQSLPPEPQVFPATPPPAYDTISYPPCSYPKLVREISFQDPNETTNVASSSAPIIENSNRANT